MYPDSLLQWLGYLLLVLAVLGTTLAVVYFITNGRDR